jgi:formyltetrahydrofolate deformylase
MPSAVLLLTCPDTKGLVSAVSDFVFRANGNIIHADQHSDPEQKLFLQRVEFDLEGFAFPRDRIAPAFQPIAERYGMTWQLRFSDQRPRVALLVSKELHCFYDLVARHRMGELEADLPLVVSNHPAPPELEPGMDFRQLTVTAETEVEAGNQLLALLQEKQIDLVILARYMRILKGPVLAAFKNRIINIHHSFLPAFAGARPYHQAHARGVKIIGATAHYVTEALDEGPILEQDTRRVSHRDTVQDLARKGRDLEKVVLARAVDLHLRHRVLPYGNKTVVFG